MATNPNPYNQPITEVFEKIERLPIKSGRMVEIKFLKATTFDGNNLKKLELLEWPEGFVDSRRIDDLADVRVCCVCEQLYHKESNIRLCPICGEHYCEKCKDTVTDKNTETEILACKLCADEANAGMVKKAWRKLWNLK